MCVLHFGVTVYTNMYTYRWLYVGENCELLLADYIYICVCICVHFKNLKSIEKNEASAHNISKQNNRVIAL